MPTFVLFSGHNDRAVITLCRFLRARGLAFAIVAAGRDDAIHRTAYADAVIFNRLDKQITVEWLAAIAQAVGGAAIHCPTTEFFNAFVLANRAAVEAAGWIVGLPERDVYERVTSKLASQAFVASLTGIAAPSAQSMWAPRAPCVFKPRVNVSGGKVLYPMLCLDEPALVRAQAAIGSSAADWFAQDYVDGQSRYLCGYLCADGRRAWFWQDNLLQQPGGKSIVLARATPAPAFDAAPLFDGLHAQGFRGPLMMEVLVDAHGHAHYIEINPRFWGPLQLALDACPQILELFVSDHGAATRAPIAHASPGPHYYAWAHGARSADCRRYPAAALEGDAQHLQALLERHDLYAAADTLALHGTH